MSKLKNILVNKFRHIVYGKIKYDSLNGSTMVPISHINDKKLGTSCDIDRYMRFVNIKDILSISRKDIETICRANCQNVYLGDKTVLCRVMTKFLVYADTEDIGITPHLCLNGYWESWTTIAMVRLIKQGWNCVDIGANHGYYTLLMADCVGPLGSVVAVEPNPKLSKLLERNIRLNGFQDRVKVIQKAVYSTCMDKVKLVIPKGFGMNATIQRDVTANDDVTVVETITLDNLIDTFNIDLIKIDAEGAEEAIWKGMKETLCRSKDVTVVMEFNCLRYSNPRTFLEDIQKNFQLRYIDYDSNIKNLTIDRCISERYGKDWMLFLNRG